MTTEEVGTPDRLVTAIAAATAMLLATIATRHGPGLSVDSVGYLSTGINLAGSHGLVALADQPLTIFPPGLPVIAALGEMVGLGVETTLRILSIVSFGAVVVLASRLVRLVVAHRVVAAGAIALVAVSPVLLEVSTMAWSEPPFLVLTLVFLLVLGRVWDRGALGRRDLAVLIALCWVGFLLRYAATSLIAVTGIALLLSIRPLDRRMFGRIAAFGVLSASLPIAWMLRNHQADGTYLGPRSPSHDTLRQVASRTSTTLGSWVVPTSGVGSGILIVVSLVGGVLVVAALRASLRQGSAQALAASAQARLLACVVFVVVYVGYLTVASLSSSFEPTNSRYLSPVFVPLVVIGASGAAALLARHPGLGWRVGVAVAVATLLLAQVDTTVRETSRGARDGIGYNSDPWTESALADATVQIVERDANAVVFSNEPNGLWGATGLQPLRWAPRDVGFRGAPLVGELDAFVDAVACHDGPSYLVVFFGGSYRAISLAELKRSVDLEQVHSTPEGAIFRVTADRATSCGSSELRPTQAP